MNYQIMDRVRRLYRQVERGIEPTAEYIANENIPAESDTLSKEMLGGDVEVRIAVEEQINAMIEDILDPDRSDSFSELEDEITEEAWNVLCNNPEWYHRDDFEKRVADEIEWLDTFVDASVKSMREKIILTLQDPIVKDRLEDRLQDMADSEYRRKRPEEYYQAPLMHKV